MRWLYCAFVPTQNSCFLFRTAYRLALWDCNPTEQQWSSAYTVHSMLIQIQAFLIAEDMMWTAQSVSHSILLSSLPGSSASHPYLSRVSTFASLASVWHVIAAHLLFCSESYVLHLATYSLVCPMWDEVSTSLQCRSPCHKQSVMLQTWGLWRTAATEDRLLGLNLLLR